MSKSSNKTRTFFKEHGFSIFLGLVVIIMLVSPDAKAWAIRQLMKTGIFNAKIEETAPADKLVHDFSFSDLDGNIVQETTNFINPAGFTIHSAVHAAREDAHYVIHLHTVAGVGVAIWLSQQGPTAAAGGPVAVAAARAVASAPSQAARSGEGRTAGGTPSADRSAPSTVVSASELMQAALPDENTALRLLLTRWQVSAVPGNVCQNVWRQGLMCHPNSGGLAQIRQLDRPVMLRLQTGTQVRHAVLTGLDARYAQLQTGEQTVSVPLGTLATLWRGDFVTLWRTPPGYRAKLLLGQRNATVGWVAAQLARLDGRTLPTTAATEFDAALEAQVQAFQLAQGLTPDGVVGATTLMQLNRAIGVLEPRLGTSNSAPLPSSSASPSAHVLHP